MTREAPPKLLVVSSTDDREELVAALRERGFDEVHAGDGGDETLADARALAPDVVVLSAGIEKGDARSLASALRREPRPPAIVLVGQPRGPVQNALDAAAFDVDQFVGRPLSAKALAFAVTRCARQARSPDRAGDPIDRATDVAIDDVVREAIAALPMVPEAGNEEVTAPVPAVIATAGEETAPHPEAYPDDLVNAPADEDPPPWREPTVVLRDGGGDSAEPEAESHDAPAPPAAAPKPPSRIGLAELAALDADVRKGEGDADGIGAHGEVGDELEGESGAADGFAGELRRKMSQMAARLFPGQRPDTGPPVDLGLAHSAHTEIDLAQLGVDTVVGRDDANLIGGELGPPGTFPDAETRVRAETTGDAPVGSEPGTTASAPGLASRGEIGGASVDVATVLADRYRGEFTGHVVFRREDAEKRVHFVEGRAVFASSNLAHDRMGELLLREGKITREQHARCREVVAETGRRMGEILVEMGCLKRRELLPAVRRHVEDIVYSLFAWEDGEYVVIPDDVASREKIRISRHPAAIILEGVRRKYSWHVLEERLGTPEAIVVTGARERVDEILASADLSPSERGFVTSLDGDRTLGEVAAARGLDLLHGYQLAYGLIALGAAQILHKGGDSRVDVDTARAPSLVGETDLAIDRQRVLVKRSLVDEADYFSLLGVRRDATRFEIRRAYEAARREYAPGSFPAEVRDELGAAIEEINQLLDEAYHVLDDDNLRAAYLAHLRD